MVEPVDPIGGRIFDSLEAASRATPTDDLALYRPLIVSAKALS
jgi:hypothetical protein